MSISYETVCGFLYREARLLDDREWDEWLTCYAPDVAYWMPAWDDDDRITEDPQSQISLIYYPSRDGLEDRVFRIRPSAPAHPRRSRAPAITSPMSSCWRFVMTRSTCGTTFTR